MTIQAMTSGHEGHDLPQGEGHDVSPDMQAMIERFKGYFASDDPIAIDQLRDLYDKGPQSEEFESLLEDIAYEALQHNEEFTTNVQRLKNNTSPDAQDISARQRQLLAEYKALIIAEAGLPTEAAMSDLELGKQKVAALLEAAAEKGEINTSGDALKILGILVKDEKTGEDKFTYPEGLFPESVDLKWQVYIASVIGHLRAVRQLAALSGEKYPVQDADSNRRIAHNSLSRDIHEILGLSTLPGKQWNFEKTRKLVGKMRDEKFPTVETAEGALTDQALLDAFGRHGVLGALNSKISALPKK